MSELKSGPHGDLDSAGRALMERLNDAFPGFGPRWKEHRSFWDDDEPVPYLDISEFARFIRDELFERGLTHEAQRACEFLEQLFLDGNELTRDLIAYGFIEDLQTFATHYPNGYATIIPLLPPTLLKVWRYVDRLWAGKSSLAEVLVDESRRAAASPNGSPSQLTWSAYLNLSDRSSEPGH